MNSFFIFVLFIFAILASTGAQDKESLDQLKAAFIRYFEPLSSVSSALQLPPAVLVEFIESARAKSNRSQLAALWRELQSAVAVERRLLRAAVKLRTEVMMLARRRKKRRRSEELQRRWTLVKDELKWATEETAKKVVEL